jgi:XRE family aerobic/anaerobic benzoate catabolism transcriptional regulator
MNAPEEGSFLNRIGERVRQARARRGMTRKLLARHSGVSERHLAELESGRGNFSVVLLRHVAIALDVPVATLVDDGPEPSPTLELAQALLRRLPPEELVQAHALLARHFAAGRHSGRSERIALIGLRGAGKSTLGRALAQRRAVPFVELDGEIETASGLRLDAIFDLYGQTGFRRFERDALEAVLERHERFVLATSGSIVSDAQTFGGLLAACRTVWLRAAPVEHMERVVAQGDLRPMAGNTQAMADLQSILATREAMYRRADLVLDTSGRNVTSSLDELQFLLQKSDKAE